jgi:hypothetical protein
VQLSIFMPYYVVGGIIPTIQAVDHSDPRLLQEVEDQFRLVFNRPEHGFSITNAHLLVFGILQIRRVLEQILKCRIP